MKILFFTLCLLCTFTSPGFASECETYEEDCEPQPDPNDPEDPTRPADPNNPDDPGSDGL